MSQEDHDLLIRLDEKMDRIMVWQQEHMERCHTVHEQHDGRITMLERWQGKTAVVLQMVSVLAGAVWAAVMRWAIH